MKSSESLTKESTLELTKEVKDDLDKIKNILRNDSEFFNTLIKECMRIGKEGEYVFFDHINRLLYQQYPELTTYTDGYQLIEKSYDFTKQLCNLDNRYEIESIIEQVYLSGDNYE